jgi:hypothetical protein
MEVVVSVTEVVVKGNFEFTALWNCELFSAYLTRIFLSFRITRTEHIVRDHLLVVLGVLATFLIAHDRNFYLLQYT